MGRSLGEGDAGIIVRRKLLVFAMTFVLVYHWACTKSYNDTVRGGALCQCRQCSRHRSRPQNTTCCWRPHGWVRNSPYYRRHSQKLVAKIGDPGASPLFRYKSLSPCRWYPSPLKVRDGVVAAPVAEYLEETIEW